MIEVGHNSADDHEIEIAEALEKKGNASADVYAITGVGSRLSQSILRLPKLQRTVLAKEVTKLDRMKERYNDRMKKVKSSFIYDQASKAIKWQHADIHWAGYASNSMQTFKNNEFEKKLPRRQSDAVLYKSASYSNMADRTYYKLMREHSEVIKPSSTSLKSGPRLEFRRIGGQTVFNTVTCTTSKEVLDDYKKTLNNRNILLSRSSTMGLP